MSSTETYNGWANRATWLVNLHLTNDPMLYEEARAVVREEYEGETVPEHVAGIVTEHDWKANRAGDALSDHVVSLLHTTDASTPEKLLTADLLSTALADVDWREIAEGLLEGDEGGYSSGWALAAMLVSLVPMSLLLVFVARLAGMLAGTVGGVA